MPCCEEDLSGAEHLCPALKLKSHGSSRVLESEYSGSGRLAQVLPPTPVSLRSVRGQASGHSSELYKLSAPVCSTPTLLPVPLVGKGVHPPPISKDLGHTTPTCCPSYLEPL